MTSEPVRVDPERARSKVCLEKNASFFQTSQHISQTYQLGKKYIGDMLLRSKSNEINNLVICSFRLFLAAAYS